MKYTMSSSRGIYLSWLTGRIYSTILADHEKLTIDIKPVKKNMIPVIYYEDITAIFMNYKITADNAAIAILFIIVFATIVIPLFFCNIYC